MLTFPGEVEVHLWGMMQSRSDSLSGMISSKEGIDHMPLFSMKLPRISWEITQIPWEICMQVRKQELELDMEQQTGSK